jgi:hypothetical protein
MCRDASSRKEQSSEIEHCGVQFLNVSLGYLIGQGNPFELVVRISSEVD